MEKPYPHKIKRSTTDELFMMKAMVMATRSGCLKFYAGAVIVDSDNRIVSSGYNGPCGKIESCSSRAENGLVKACYKDDAGISHDHKNSGRCPAIHAEENALYLAGRERAKGNRMYITIFPCLECARRIGANGIEEVVYLFDYPEKADAMRELERQDVKVRKLDLPKERALELMERFYDQPAQRM